VAERDITATPHRDFNLRARPLLANLIQIECKLLISRRHFDNPGGGDTEIRGCQAAVSDLRYVL